MRCVDVASCRGSALSATEGVLVKFYCAADSSTCPDIGRLPEPGNGFRHDMNCRLNTLTIMSGFRGSLSPGPSRPKKRRIDLEEHTPADALSDRGQDYSRNLAQDYARAHYGNVYGNVYYDSSLPQRTSEDAAGTSETDSFMESLRFQSMGERHATIHKAYTSTFKWLLDHPKHVEWRDQIRSIEHNRLLWIKGKPGAGKSTIMKFAFDHAASEWKGHTVVSFFFNARGVHLEKQPKECIVHCYCNSWRKCPT